MLGILLGLFLCILSLAPEILYSLTFNNTFINPNYTSRPNNFDNCQNNKYFNRSGPIYKNNLDNNQYKGNYSQYCFLKPRNIYTNYN